MIKEFTPINFVPDKSHLEFIKISVLCKSYSLNKALYKCECGNVTEAYIGNVKSGKTTSCGCRMHLGTPKHGLSEHPLYSVWENMITRCYNKKVKQYTNYGARGVTICEDWLKNPGNFIKWGIENGWQYGLELDKDIKGNGLLYSPETCCFVTRKINVNNRRTSKRVEFKGVIKTAAQWSDELNISQSTLCIRLKKWSIEKALTTPVKQKL